jgi:hypothetical protein
MNLSNSKSVFLLTVANFACTLASESRYLGRRELCNRVAHGLAEG